MNKQNIKIYSKNAHALENISKEWLSANKNSFKVSTYQTYERIVYKYFITSNLSKKKIERITQKDINVFSDELLSYGLAPKTVNDILLVLNSVFSYADIQYGITKMKINYVKITNKEMRVLSVEEQKIFEKYLNTDTDIYKFAVLLSLYTGLRIGEVCALQWKDIFNGTIAVTKTMHRLYDENRKSRIFIDSPKTDRSNRIIPVPVFLNEQLESMRSDDKSFVLSTDKLDRIEPRLLQIKFKRMTDDCQFQEVTFHTLRHTFATRCVECGFDIKTLSEILGHSDIKTTLNKYVHSSMEFKRENMEKLSTLSVACK